ncbi:unnamed protein product [Fusarium graminearum]|uniref:Uncharacterized protein n=1 Tax=Gibberella zeae TaxID=5518 RepID=A0A4U9EZX0_GIBZA|nr:unnamed protein product [Fusarium graminearum]CAF3540097.1 unnamed protein product [Fusarium graminearum]CAF3630440.1 unnamed protein product [Fusarium graminearum]CAG1973848.1 unnamed protein product [Fusarium graminearum]CAG1984893.1 unnamed protein product [Fusarium graminearum]
MLIGYKLSVLFDRGAVNLSWWCSRECLLMLAAASDVQSPRRYARYLATPLDNGHSTANQ